MRKWLLGAGKVLLRVALALAALFAAGALAVHVHGAVGIVVLVAAAAAQVFVKPLGRMAAFSGGAFVLVLAWFATLSPSNDREWQSEVSRTTRVEFDGDRVVIRDVRDFDWTGAETANPRWRDRTIDLSELESLWLALSYWDGNTSICHTMLSFGFADGTWLAVSVETRKEVGETYSAWRGFFKQYEIFYVLAEERDLLGVRAKHRDEDLYLYPLTTPPDRRRALLEDILRTAGSLAEEPEWYGALQRNCTTTLQQHIDHALGRPSRFRWDTMLNGSIDEKAWRNGGIADPRPFPEVRAAHRITEAARTIGDAQEYSRRLRSHIGTTGR